MQTSSRREDLQGSNLAGSKPPPSTQAPKRQPGWFQSTLDADTTDDWFRRIPNPGPLSRWPPFLIVFRTCLDVTYKFDGSLSGMQILLLPSQTVRSGMYIVHRSRAQQRVRGELAAARRLQDSAIWNRGIGIGRQVSESKIGERQRN